MVFQFYLPNGQSWEIKNPNLANRSSILTTCVRRYYFENTSYALLACVDYHVPDRVFYDYTVTRQEGTFPLSSQRDYEILHYLMESNHIPLSHYIECEKKLQHMVSKIKHMQGMAKDLVADMKTRTNKDTGRQAGTHVAAENHTAKQTPEYEPKNTTASNQNLVRLQKLQCLASKLKQIQDMRKVMVTNLNKNTNTNEGTDRKECTHVTIVDQTPKYAPGNSAASCMNPASPPNIKNWDSKFKCMQHIAKDAYANYMKQRANEDIDRKAVATIANTIPAAEYHTTKQTPENVPQNAESSCQNPATLQKLKDLASKLEYMKELYTTMKKGTHKDMDRKVNTTIANVEETEYHTAKQTTEFQTTSRTAEAKHQSPVTPPNIRNWDSKFSYMQKMAKNIYADYMKNRTHEGACMDEKKR